MKFDTRKTSIPLGRYLELIGKYTKDKSFVNFFSSNNVARPNPSGYIHLNNQQMSVDFFLGRSHEKNEDLIKIFHSYENRVPRKFLPICQMNEVDFLCIGVDSKIYHWTRDKNDLYFDSGRENSYLPQNVDLQDVYNCFEDFLGSISTASNGGEVFYEDDYDNPEIPFEDDDIEDDFKHPELFFKQNQQAIGTQLKKLQLSQKGRELLLLFEKMGLT